LAAVKDGGEPSQLAWKEMYEGKEVIVHRKGATPAGKNVLGIIQAA